MTQEQAAQIAEQAEKLNQRFGQYLLHAVDDEVGSDPDERWAALFRLEDDELLAALSSYWEAHKHQVV